ncbi:M56 family metallopeptidase [Clostridium manihotivorum]|uniref:Peptidase M56 domain-containing protein n=1 Tax=Clostridium manihotivorum TaxID=2320868 RepID=A0A410DZD5_9CLOT|nr:M56 family metallopeptidase [Clostridium manihotivorum]QAA34427.1 hypothetical protein C1I91_23850 [Clostridium manihotivorum]
MNLEVLFKIILSLSFMGSIVAISIMLVKRIFKTKLKANWHYLIWFLLIVRLLMPYAPESKFSVFNILKLSSYSMSTDKISFNNKDIDAFQTTNNHDTSKNNQNNIKSDSQENLKDNNHISKTNGSTLDYKTLSIIWAIGAAILFLNIVVVNRTFAMKLNLKPKCKDESTLKLLVQCKISMSIARDIPIVDVDNNSVPSIYGWIKPRLLISFETLSNLSEQEKRYIFMHELGHLKRKDVLVNWLLIILQCLHWFNPLIWYSFFKMREDCEIACDSYVLSKLNDFEYKSYGETIINLASTITRDRFGIVTTSMVRNKSSIKTRIKMIAAHGKHSFKWALAAGALILVIVLVGMTNGKGKVFNKNSGPQVNIIATLGGLTDEEYGEVGTKELKSASKDDFRKLYLKVEIANAKNVSSKLLEVPESEDIVKPLNNSNNRFWFGPSSYQNNDSEDFATAERTPIIYYKGLSDDEVKELLKTIKIEVGWTNEDGSEYRKEYLLGDVLNFDKSKADTSETASEEQATNLASNFFEQFYNIESSDAIATLQPTNYENAYIPFKKYMTNEAISDLVSNRFYLRNIKFSADNQARGKIKNIEFEKSFKDSKENKLETNFTVTIQETYTKDNTVKTDEEKGRIGLIFENNQWKINTFSIDTMSKLLNQSVK